MLSTGLGLADEGRRNLLGEGRGGGAQEWIGMTFHGYAVTHLDSLAHMFWDGRMYGGRRPARSTCAAGAPSNDVAPRRPTASSAAGVLLDAAAERGVDWMEPGEYVLPEDLERIEARQGVRVGPGDIVALRTGYGRRLRERGPDDVGKVGRAGWHVGCIPWLAEREVAVIAADTPRTCTPTATTGCAAPCTWWASWPWACG